MNILWWMQAALIAGKALDIVEISWAYVFIPLYIVLGLTALCFSIVGLMLYLQER